MKDMRSHNIVAHICWYHVVTCPKYRRKVLTPPKDARLKPILGERIERWGQELSEMEAMPEHMHLLVGCALSSAFIG